MKKRRTAHEIYRDFCKKNRATLRSIASGETKNDTLWKEYELLWRKFIKEEQRKSERFRKLDHEKLRIKAGYTKRTQYQRPIRIKEKGLLGQEVWYTLQKEGFVRNEGVNKPLTKFEQRLKNWLIWGHWEL